MAVQERLQVAVRGRDPRPFLDLEDELAAGGPVTSGGDHEQPVCVREACRDPLGGGRLVDAARDEIGGGLRVKRPARDVRPDCREREDRRQVADDVAPVLVELLGRDHDVGEGCPGRPVADRHDGRTRAGGAARGQCGVRRGRAAFVGHADHEAAAHRVERQLERLDAGERRGRQAGGPKRVAQDLDAGERRVLRRAAAGDQDRPAGGSRLGDGSGEHGRRAGLGRQRRQQAPRPGRAPPRSSRSCGTAARGAARACRCSPTDRAARAGEHRDRRRRRSWRPAYGRPRTPSDDGAPA